MYISLVGRSLALFRSDVVVLHDDYDDGRAWFEHHQHNAATIKLMGSNENGKLFGVICWASSLTWTHLVWNANARFTIPHHIHTLYPHRKKYTFIFTTVLGFVNDTLWRIHKAAIACAVTLSLSFAHYLYLISYTFEIYYIKEIRTRTLNMRTAKGNENINNKILESYNLCAFRI